MNELNRDEFYYGGKYYPNQLERLQSAVGKSFSPLEELKSLGSPVGMPYMNYFMGQVGEKPPVETNKSFYDPLYMTVSGIPSNLIEGQAKVNNRILQLGEYVDKNLYLQQFYPSIRVPK